MKQVLPAWIIIALGIVGIRFAHHLFYDNTPAFLFTGFAIVIAAMALYWWIANRWNL